MKEYAGPRLTLDVSHNNLFGGNRALGVRLRLGVHEQQFQTTYHEPRLFNHETLDGFGTLTIETTNRPVVRDERNRAFFTDQKKEGFKPE